MDELDDILNRSRRVYRATSSGGEEPGVPPGFAERVRRRRAEVKSPSLLLWERASYVGTAGALAIAMMTYWQAKQPVEALASDPWMEMPMLIEEPGGNR